MSSKGFFRRHKNKLITLGLIIGGGYYTLKWTLSNLQQNFLKNSQQKLKTSQKLEHFVSIDQTSNTAVFDFLKFLNDQIKKLLPSEKILEELHSPNSKTINKYELWEELKIICYMYLISNNTDSKLQSLFNQRIQQEFLENIQIFIKNGLPKLIDKFKDYIRKSFKNVSLKEKLTITQIQHELSGLFIIPHEYILDHINIEEFRYEQVLQNSNELLVNLNIEAYDLISCQNCLETFIDLNQQAITKFGRVLINEILPQSSLEDTSIHPYEYGIPLAKLIPILDRVYEKLVNPIQEQNESVKELLLNLRLNIFTANIYETFSYTIE